MKKTLQWHFLFLSLRLMNPASFGCQDIWDYMKERAVSFLKDIGSNPASIFGGYACTFHLMCVNFSFTLLKAKITRVLPHNAIVKFKVYYTQKVSADTSHLIFQAFWNLVFNNTYLMHFTHLHNKVVIFLTHSFILRLFPRLSYVPNYIFLCFIPEYSLIKILVQTLAIWL